jgi:HD-GYP domain-containing protein (c-di-GMP phosphodiesterase class II)
VIRFAALADAILGSPTTAQAGSQGMSRPAEPSPIASGFGNTVSPAPARLGDPASPAPTLFAAVEAGVSHIQTLAVTGGTLCWDDLGAVLERVVDHLAGCNDLFWVAATRGADAEADYLASHHARVAIMATRIGANLGFDRAEQVALGMAGCLFDLGLAGVPESLLRTAEGLPPSGHALYREHPRRAVEIIQRWQAPYPSIEQAVLHHHERERGQGYPEGLGGQAIHPHGKILGLLDQYTRLTVPPSWQPPRTPYEVMRELVRARRDAFPGPLIKALLAELSVFPPGTQVRLSTGETALVREANRHQPLRPKVELAGGDREIDLVETPFIYIVGAVGDDA